MKQAHIATPDKSMIPFGLHLERLFVKDWVWVTLLLILGIVSRVPLRSEILYHWDSVNFAYAIQEFDMAREQPQPPGYIVYVWLSRLVDSLIGDAQITLVTISIISSTLATVALFYLGRSMFDRRVGLIAALLLATSPLFWFYSEIALPHTLDTLLIIVSVWWLYETMRGKYGCLYPAIAILAIAGGIRQQTLVFLGPLILFALRPVGWRRFFMAGTLGVALCLAWFIPLMILSGGLSNYMQGMGEFTDRFQRSTSILMGAGWWGVRRNLIKLILYTLYGWSIALLQAIIYAAIRLRRKAWPGSWEKLIFLSLWMIPALMFYALIHMGQQGLVFVFLPALLLSSAVGLARLPLLNQPSRLALAVAALVLANVGIFYVAPEYPLGTGTLRLLTYNTLVNSDRYYQDRLTVIRENFAPESTMIVAVNWHHLEYYLPEYNQLRFTIGSKWEIDAGVTQSEIGTAFSATPAELGLLPAANGIATVVIFDPALADFNETPKLVRQLFLPHGDSLDYLEMAAEDRLYIDADSFGLDTN